MMGRCSLKTTKRKRGRSPLVLVYYSLLILLCLLSACSSNPSESDAKKFIENKYNNLIKVKKIKETNSQKREFEGVKFYRIEYLAEIEYLDDVVVQRFDGKLIGIGTGKKGAWDFLLRPQLME